MVGTIIFSNYSGIGVQSRRLTYMLKPQRILAVDSSGFSKNTKQNWEWYSQFSGYKTKGFPTNKEIDVFTRGLTTIFVIENPLNFYLLNICRDRGIKLYIQSNYEFCDHLNKNLTLPTKFLMPSYWKIDEMKALFGQDRVQYLPPPINPAEFTQARNINFKRKGKKKFIHIIGTLATKDRNGTLSLIEALKYSKEDYQLTIRSQHDLPKEYITKDKRVRYIYGNDAVEETMYYDYDAMILPRRYGGLSLVCNEALMSGLPVIMPNISPNNSLLPKKWLVNAKKTDELMTRTNIDVYSVMEDELGRKIDEFASKDINNDKIDAFEIAYNQFSETELLPKYQNL